MGFRPVILSLVPLLLAVPAFAQEQSSPAEPVFNLPHTTQQSADPNRQGPELDVFRGAPVTPPPVAPPPVALPTVTPPPVVLPAPQPAQQQPPAPVAAPPQRPAAPARQTEPARSAPPPDQPAPPAATVPAPTGAEPLPTPQAAPPAAPAPSESPTWPWIAGGLALLAALAGWLLLRRRANEGSPPAEPAAEEERTPPVPAPRATPVPPPAPQPHPAAPPPPPSPAPTAPADVRPWVEVVMEVRSARLSLMGATIGYALTLHNRGDCPAEDILIRSLIANADTAQQAVLQQFFAGSTGLPTHSVVSIAPGQSERLTGELRLMPDQIAPVQMGDRSLLIPLVAFDAQYRWTSGDGAPIGSGRTGRAFIVGQEKSPPADRLAPFRLDLGPRQFRTPGSRATALTLAS